MKVGQKVSRHIKTSKCQGKLYDGDQLVATIQCSIALYLEVFDTSSLADNSTAPGEYLAVIDATLIDGDWEPEKQYRLLLQDARECTGAFAASPLPPALLRRPQRFSISNMGSLASI